MTDAERDALMEQAVNETKDGGEAMHAALRADLHNAGLRADSLGQIQVRVLLDSLERVRAKRADAFLRAFADHVDDAKKGKVSDG